jgi:hypothetical protein
VVGGVRVPSIIITHQQDGATADPEQVKSWVGGRKEWGG